MRVDTVKRLGFARGCDCFSALLGFSTTERVPKVERYAFGKLSNRSFLKMRLFSAGNLSVVGKIER